MEFRIDTDTWFVFSLLFIGALALLIFIFVAIPYLARKKQLNRIRNRRKNDNYSRLEKKYSERRITNLQANNQKLQIDLEHDLHQILQSDLKKPDLLPFFSNFEKLYPDFRQSLQKIIPDITANELKLCALLRLNLSSKEVSQILNITPASVNKARYRIRKKIGLDSKEDLFVYLSNI
ncbi:MAG: helix-turn-helix transcriptional regulator [Bacteroidetes bacterium]|jgi:DNA-binding CsgD family transcriptional regulator|nr:helix-turn-helix transcriptional regulator [Bacteroidota bacterium]